MVIAKIKLSFFSMSFVLGIKNKTKTIILILFKFVKFFQLKIGRFVIEPTNNVFFLFLC